MSDIACRLRMPNNHRHGLFRAVVGLLLLAGTVPALAAPLQSMSVLPLTSEERVWLAVSQGIMFGFTDALKLDLRAGLAGYFESRHVKC